MAFQVSVIIPAYNEEAIIEGAVRAAYDILSGAGADYEIIVVNDGSSDATREILNRSFATISGIRIIHKEKNEGFGSAIRTGIAAAGRQYILCVPADSPLTPALYAAFSSHAHRADVLVSYRREKLGYSFAKLLNSYVYQRMISALFDMHLRDYNWIHMYDSRIFREGGISIRYDGIFMLAEILIRAQRGGFTFYEFEVEQTQRLTGIATASRPAAILRTVRDMLVFWWRG